MECGLGRVRARQSARVANEGLWGGRMWREVQRGRARCTHAAGAGWERPRLPCLRGSQFCRKLIARLLSARSLMLLLDLAHHTGA